MKYGLFPLLPAIVLAGCDSAEDKFYPQMMNLAYLYQFEPVPGNVKQTHQQIFNSAGSKMFDVLVDFDKQGCVTHITLSGGESGHLEVKRDGNQLKGHENDKDMTIQLGEDCQIIKKETPGLTVDIAYNPQGLVDTLSSASTDAKYHLKYDQYQRINAFTIESRGKQLVSATTQWDAQGKLFSDFITTVKRGDKTKIITSKCQYKKAVPYACDITTTYSDGQPEEKKHAQLDTQFY